VSFAPVRWIGLAWATGSVRPAQQSGRCRQLSFKILQILDRLTFPAGRGELLEPLTPPVGATSQSSAGLGRSRPRWSDRFGWRRSGHRDVRVGRRVSRGPLPARRHSAAPGRSMRPEQTPITAGGARPWLGRKFLAIEGIVLPVGRHPESAAAARPSSLRSSSALAIGAAAAAAPPLCSSGSSRQQQVSGRRSRAPSARSGPNRPCLGSTESRRLLLHQVKAGALA